MQAQDVMMTWVARIGVGAAVQEAARLMLERRISALPVIDGKDRVVGIVSEGDLVRRLATATVRPEAKASSDRVLRRRVLKGVAESGANAMYVNVTVEGGTVHLWGGVRSEVEQKALRAAAKAVNGVRKVEDHTFAMPQRLQGALGSD